MKRILSIVVIACASQAYGWIDQTNLESVVVGTTEYKNCRIEKRSPDSVVVFAEHGTIATVKTATLPVELQSFFNYDSQEAHAYRTRQNQMQKAYAIQKAKQDVIDAERGRQEAAVRAQQEQQQREQQAQVEKQKQEIAGRAQKYQMDSHREWMDRHPYSSSFESLGMR
jgi:hypothetical protein